MKISDVRLSAITHKDIEKWLDNRPLDEVYSVKEAAEMLKNQVHSLGMKISNVSDKYRYRVNQNQCLYGNPGAIEKLRENQRSVIEG